MKIDIETRGFKELERKLEKLEPRVQRRVLQGAVTSAIRKGRKQIKDAAPVGEERSVNSLKYDRLTKNLKVKRLKRTKANEKASRVDTGDAFWALFYELGTKTQPARPFMALAFQRAIPEMLKQLGDRLKIGIEKEAKKK